MAGRAAARRRELAPARRPITRSPSPPATARTTSACRPRSTSWSRRIRSLDWEQDEALHETRLKGISDEHLKVALARLKRRYGVAVDAQPPVVGYKESIRKPVTQRGRHKKQSGGHGQFGDVVIEIRPLGRGEGFKFDEKIHGGAVPKQYIPAVEQGVRDAMAKGPLGFPVVDVAVTLVDGSYHTRRQLGARLPHRRADRR